MGYRSKGLASVLILTIVISGLALTTTVKPVNAQSTPTPSVPQFTVQLAGPLFTLNTTYSLDPDTGKIVANIGYTNEYSYLEIVIENQQFDSKYGSIYYNITVNGTPYEWVNSLYPYPEQTADSNSTVINLNVQNLLGYDRAHSFVGISVSIQVQAMLGNMGTLGGLFTSCDFGFFGTVGDLSNSQTLSIPANVPLSVTPTSPSPTSPPSSTSTTTISSPSTAFLLITNAISLIVIVILLAVIVALVVTRRKTINLNNQAFSNGKGEVRIKRLRSCQRANSRVRNFAIKSR